MYQELLEAEPSRQLWTWRAAEALLMLGRSQEVIDHVDHILKRLPGLESEHRRYLLHLQAEAHRAQGELTQAQQVFEASIDEVNAQPESFSACPYQGLGELYRRSGRGEEALELFVQAADGEPSSADSQLVAARQAHALGRDELALRYLERARSVGSDPELETLEASVRQRLHSISTPLGRLGVAVLAFESYDFDLAEALLDNQEHWESQPELKVLAALTLVQKAEYAQAEALLDEVEQDHPWMPSPPVARAHLAVAARDSSMALAHLASSRELKAADDERLDEQLPCWTSLRGRMAALARGWSAANSAEHIAAAAVFDGILDDHPHDVFAMLGRANAAMATGDLDMAEHLLQLLLEQDPDNQYATAELALVAYNRGNNELATQLFERARLADPERYTCPYEGLGMVALRQGRTEEARAHFERAIELNPHIEFAKYNGLARIRLEEGALDEAERLLRKSIANHPENPEARELLALLEQRQGR